MRFFGVVYEPAWQFGKVYRVKRAVLVQVTENGKIGKEVLGMLLERD